MADVTFELKKEGKTAVELDGMESSNVRDGLVFKKVEAVSFKDYNHDGNGDIIIICSYQKNAEAVSEARIYSGSEQGSFTLEKKLSGDVNGALSELTIESICGFLGADRIAPAGE